MALNFRRFVNGINLVPKVPNVNAEMGDLEVDSSTGRLKYHNGTISDNIVTATSTDTLENKTITDPDIVILDNPIVFQETGGGTDTISMTAPASVPASYTFTLPPDPGTVDYVLRTNGVGATSWVPPTVDAIPTGSVFPFAGSTAPASYKLCDGSQYDPALEPTLYAVIGTTYNTGGENPGWFRTPDLRGRSVAGRDDMGGTPANRLTNAGSGINGANLGAAGGTETHSLSTGENGTHNHTQDPHDHGVGTYGNASSAVSGTITASASAVSGTVGGSDGTHTHTFTTGTDSVAHTHTNAASAEGGGSGGTGASSSAAGSTTATGNGYILNAGTNGGNAGFIESSNANTLHTHSGTTDTTGSGHGHGFSLTAAAQSILHSLIAAAQVFSGISGSTVATNQSSGLGTAHQNTQPTIVLNYIIKA